MSEQLHLLITKILKSAQYNPLTNGEIRKELKEKYEIEASRQTVYRNLISLEKLKVVTSSFRDKKSAWSLKKDTEQEASQNFNKFENELNFDFTQLIDNWLNQLPCNISIWGGILQKSGIRYTGSLSSDVKDNPLFPDFKKFVEDLLESHPVFCENPFTEWEKFDKKAMSFIEKGGKFVREKIAKIIVEELVNKKGSSNMNIIVFKWDNENIEIPMELIQGLLYRLNCGVKWKSGDFAPDWLEKFIRFDSRLYDLPEAYCYYIRQLEDTMMSVASIFEDAKRLPRNHIFIASVREEKQNRKAFKTEMDKRIEKMLSRIGHSKRIKETTLELWNEKEELFNILNNIYVSLEKIKNIK